MADENNGVLDKGLFGHFIRSARTEAGYEKAEDFAQAISEKTGYPVSKQTIYSIESGKQEPKISLYLAMMRVLRPNESPKVDRVVLDSIPPRWRLPMAVEEDIVAASDNDENIDTMTQTYSDMYEGLADSVAAVQQRLSETLTESMQPSIQLMSDSLRASMGQMAELASSTSAIIEASGIKDVLKSASLATSRMALQGGSYRVLGELAEGAQESLKKEQQEFENDD